MINHTFSKNIPALLLATPLSSQVFTSLRKVPSYIWLLNRVTCLNLSLAQQFNLSLHTFKGFQQSQSKVRYNAQGSFVFSGLSHATTKNKLKSSLFLRQGQRVRPRRAISTRHTQPSKSNFLHQSALWQPTYLLRRESFHLLGPALRRRHLNKVAPTFLSLAETDKTRIEKRLFPDRKIPSKFTKSSLAEVRLSLFMRYLKLNRYLPIPLLGFKRRRRRLPRISAYLFLGLRRPPLVVLKTPFTNLWKSFVKVVRGNRRKAGPTKTRTDSNVSTLGLFQYPATTPQWRRVLPPRPKARLKSASLRRWSKNLGRFRKKSLHTYFYKRYQRLKIRAVRSRTPLDLSFLNLQEIKPRAATSISSNDGTLEKPSSWIGLRARQSFRDLRVSLKRRVFSSKMSLVSKRVRREVGLRNTFQPNCRPLRVKRSKGVLHLTNRTLKPVYKGAYGYFSSSASGSLASSYRKVPKSTKKLSAILLYRLKSKKSRRVYKNRKPFRQKWTPVTRVARRAYTLSTRRLAAPQLCSVRLASRRLPHSNLHKFTLLWPSDLHPRTRLPSLSALSLARSARAHLDQQLLDKRTVLKINPLYSRTFVASMFSFIGYSMTSPSRISDITRSVTDYSGDLRYLIFPDVNAAKAAIFRRLNKQRFLMRSRMQLFNRVHFGNIEKNPRLQLIHKALRTSGVGLSETPLNGKAAMSVSRNWVLHNESRLIDRSTYRTPRIGRIRFKPGYYRIWRLARASAREILGFTSRYQYRLTPKLQRHYFQARQGDQSRLSLTVEFALLTSHLIPDHWSLKELLSSCSVYLNGICCTNRRLRLFCGDFVQMLINLKYYIALRWLDSWSVQKKTKVSKIFYRKLKPSPTNKSIKTVRKLPHWFFDLQYTHTDIPKYFEVDYFTLSVFLLHDQISFERWLPSRARQLNPLVINMYNWKYIT